MPPRTEAWPEITLSEWEGTWSKLLLLTQVVGKIRLFLEPMVNQWWQVPLYVSARGLTTSLMHSGSLGVEAEFDFVHGLLEIRTTDGSARQIPLVPGTVSGFYEATLAALDDLGVKVSLYDRPVEMPVVIPFPEDVEERPFDGDAVKRFWLALVQAERVMYEFRARFQGKVSPVHFFWGAGDLAVTRFSGNPAPKHRGGIPNCPDIVQVLAYNQQVSSCGFWPGGTDEGSFYSYAYPEPEGFESWPVEPKGAYYDPELGEFILPYRQVRLAQDPDGDLLSFFQSTYEAAAVLARWDRSSLEARFPHGRDDKSSPTRE